MNKTKKFIVDLLKIGVMIIGVYMLAKYDWPTPPALSGLGFLFAGLAMWIPRCPVCNKILKDERPNPEM